MIEGRYAKKGANHTLRYLDWILLFRNLIIVYKKSISDRSFVLCKTPPIEEIISVPRFTSREAKSLYLTETYLDLSYMT